MTVFLERAHVLVWVIVMVNMGFFTHSIVHRCHLIKGLIKGIFFVIAD